MTVTWELLVFVPSVFGVLALIWQREEQSAGAERHPLDPRSLPPLTRKLALVALLATSAPTGYLLLRPSSAPDTTDPGVADAADEPRGKDPQSPGPEASGREALFSGQRSPDFDAFEQGGWKER